MKKRNSEFLVIVVVLSLICMLLVGIFAPVHGQEKSSGITDGEMYRRYYSKEKWVQNDSTSIVITYTRTDYLGKNKFVVVFCESLRECGNKIRYIDHNGLNGVINFNNAYDLRIGVAKRVGKLKEY